MLIELNLRPSKRQLRQFGWIALAILVFAGTSLLRTGALFGWSFGEVAPALGYGLILVGLLSGLFALLSPRANRPLFVLLTIVTYPIGLVVSHVVMLFLFFAIITPVGCLFRAIGRDPLHRKWDDERTSYWEDLAEASDNESYFRQF
jgi:hypothetical protein